jgi:uncharacterized membrane protein
MSDDRYAPPTAPLTEDTALRGTGRIDLGEAFRVAWSGTWENFPFLFFSGLVALVVATLSALTIVGIVFVVPVLVFGILLLLLHVLDRRAQLADLFAGFGEYGRVLGAMLALFALFVVVSLVGQSVTLLGRLTGLSLLSFFGSLVNLVWSFGVMPRLAFATYYVVDQGLAPADAMRTSWERTSDQKLTCTVLAILSILIPVLGVLCLVVGVIPGWMISSLMHAAAYRQLAGRSGAP